MKIDKESDSDGEADIDSDEPRVTLRHSCDQQ